MQNETAELLALLKSIRNECIEEHLWCRDVVYSASGDEKVRYVARAEAFEQFVEMLHAAVFNLVTESPDV